LTRQFQNTMKTKWIIILSLLVSPFWMKAQNNLTKTEWSLSECIDYALSQNIQIRKSGLTSKSIQVNSEQATAQKLPSLNASVRQNFSWSNREDATTGTSSFSGSSSSNLSVNSSVTIFNGMRLSNRIEQAKLEMKGSLFNTETIRESVSLNILNAFLQVLFTGEQVKNNKKQLESTAGELNLAQERLNMKIISMSDYLQVKSQLSSEKLSLINAENQYAIAKVNLMQLMELPVDNNFTIKEPALGDLLNKNISPDAREVYNIALSIKPQVKSAELEKQSKALDEKIAMAGYYPSLSADAGLSTGYSSFSNQSGYWNELGNQISPAAGLSLSIPIFQKKQVKTSVALAKISYNNAELDEINTKNQLRKEIEQACLDVVSAQSEYEASLEKFQSTSESYALAEEKFKQGLINSVDFLFEKTNQIVAESQLLQSKFNLIFTYKILDFYSGVPIKL
jgi:outer membrane protein